MPLYKDLGIVFILRHIVQPSSFLHVSCPDFIELLAHCTTEHMTLIVDLLLQGNNSVRISAHTNHFKNFNYIIQDML